jgi:hypothetical protein
MAQRAWQIFLPAAVQINHAYAAAVSLGGNGTISVFITAPDAARDPRSRW